MMLRTLDLAESAQHVQHVPVLKTCFKDDASWFRMDVRAKKQKLKIHEAAYNKLVARLKVKE